MYNRKPLYLLLTGLAVLEVVNVDVTNEVLIALLTDETFWPFVLAVAFSLASFAAIIKFTLLREEDDPIGYLFAAWLLSIGMNVLLLWGRMPTFWLVSILVLRFVAAICLNLEGKSFRFYQRIASDLMQL